MEMINGGYGIKNPLLSTEIHLQSLPEQVNGKCSFPLFYSNKATRKS